MARACSIFLLVLLMLVPGALNAMMLHRTPNTLNYLGNVNGSGVPYSASHNIGAASGTKSIVLCFAGNLSGAQSFTGVTVAGVTMTQAVAASTQDACAIFWGNVTAGGNQTIAFNSNSGAYSMHMWEVDIGKVLTLGGSGSDTTIPLQWNPSPGSRSVIFGIAKNRGTTTWNWNNSDLPDLIVGSTVVTGSNRNTSAAAIVPPGTYNLEATSNTGANQPALAGLYLQ